MDTEKIGKKNDSENADSEIIRRENETLADEVASRGATILKLEQAIAAKESEIAALKNELDVLKQTLDELGKAVTRAVAAYKEMVIQTNPGILPEMVTGDSIDAVRTSVKNARAIMDKVRQEMEAEAARTRVPAGAPQRAAPDLSGLSAREKIQYALGTS